MHDRVIALLDANAFFASCAVLADPTLKGRPVVVAGDPAARRGIILAVSYEARRHARGPLRAGLPLEQALRVLPKDVVLVAPDHRLYAQVSNRLYEVMTRFTPVIERASIDEAWMDWTGCLHLFGGDPLSMAKQLKEAVRAEVGVPVSVGIGWSKGVAKQAAELQKPDGLTLLSPADWQRRVWPRPVGELNGVGPKTAPRLRRLGIATIGHLAQADPQLLRAVLGVSGEHLRVAARGEDRDPVNPQAGDDAKSIGHSMTLPYDVRDPEELRAVLLNLVEQVGARLRKGGYLGRTVTVHIRDVDFRTISRSKTLAQPTDVTTTIYQTAARLLAAHWPPGKPARLLGVSVGDLRPAGTVYRQPSLFEAETHEKDRRVDQAVDAIRARFGEQALVRGSVMRAPRR